MARALQPYASFTIGGNRVNFYSSKISPIDSMLTDKGQESAMLLECKHIVLYKLHNFCNYK